jgi:hypothetical protein
MGTDDQADKKGEQIQVKLTLDADVASLLLELAGSPRKQGEFVSKLIREAAARRNAPDVDVEGLRLQMLGLAKSLEDAVRKLGQSRQS